MRILVNLLVNLALVKAKLKNSDICFQRAGHSRRHGGYLWPLPKHKPLACSRHSDPKQLIKLQIELLKLDCRHRNAKKKFKLQATVKAKLKNSDGWEKP